MEFLVSRGLPAAAIAAICIGVSAPPHSAQAQIWIGQVVGDVTAQQVAAAREKACREGQPAAPKDVETAKEEARQLMAAYFDLTSTSKPRDIDRVFATKLKDVTWKDEQGAALVSQLGSRLDGPTPTLTPLSFVVAGDAFSARGIWEATTSGTEKKAYAVDFKAIPNTLFGITWRIWHMTVSPIDKAPPAPADYCHFDADQAW